MSKEAIKKHFDEAAEVLNTFNNATNIEVIHSGLLVMVEALRNGNKLISCGNGGSMSDAMHFAEELSGRFRNERKALAAVSISDPTHISCVANDYGYEYVFSRYVEAMGNEGDVLLGISTSGNSKNVINAVEVAKRMGMKTIILTGKTGGLLSNIADIEIRAPHSEFADRAQEIHIKVIHALIDGIEKALKLS
ncbi:MAG: D-sedoheptulose 7-phosphate isomerase [Crocinitomicaceae bacterium]|nr:D-sedoheptulose 7-phosphate isomerase [Crocinitomicaceae bacterium]OUT69441.1 MAG: phosphoheptose isomerase [Crocinitomicaceae bacterium TMED16]